MKPAQFDNQEPVAWITRRTGDGGVVISGYETCEPTDYDAIPVYTAPPKRDWQGLTDDELDEITYSTETCVDYELFDEGEYGTEINIYSEVFARAIEAKLREKNG